MTAQQQYHKLDPIFESCQKYEEFLSEQLLSRLHSDVVDFKKITKT